MDVMYSQHLAERMAENIGRMIREERQLQGGIGSAAGGSRGKRSADAGQGQAKPHPEIGENGAPRKTSSVRFSDGGA